MRVFAVVAVLMLTLSVNAQETLFEKADHLFMQLQYAEALPALKAAYKKEKDKAVKSEIIFKIAECYRYTLKTKNAVTWYKKAIKANYPDDVAQLFLAESLKSFGQYDEAKVEYEIYNELAPDDSRGAKGPPRSIRRS